MKLPVPQKVTLKDPKDFRLIGKPTGRLDARAKSSGGQGYGIDVRLPGMLTAVVAPPPVFGAQLKSVDDTAAKAIGGVKAVLRVPLDRGGEGVAVVADGYWPAEQGRDALKLEWDTAAVEKADSGQAAGQLPRTRPQDRRREVRRRRFARLASAPHKISAEFLFPYLAHAPMEPLNCTVAFSGNRPSCGWARRCRAGRHGRGEGAGHRPQAVRVHTQMAGGFGRRAIPTSDYVVEACQVAKARARRGLNAPNAVERGRRQGRLLPAPHVHRAEIGFDAQAHPGLGHDRRPIHPQGLALRGLHGEGRHRHETMVEGMKEPYQVPMRLSVHHPRGQRAGAGGAAWAPPARPTPWRTLLDEVARAASQDRGLPPRADGRDPRHKAALQLAVDQSGYGTQLAPGRTWGVAVHESFQSVVAYVVEASVEQGDPGCTP